ncbi:MAG: FHA domain-containing protein [Gemmatimonadaceae bacterium]|nr:FHA domain-containing protein [Gemmatimonadaceae bacterium]
MALLTFKHLTGSRATQVDSVRLGAHRELILGRAQSAAVRFDAREDRAVGRQHARIVPVDQTLGRFALSDLETRNGTFVNGRRVTDAVELVSGDVVQLGVDGPRVEVTFTTEPDLARQPG